MNVVDLVVLFLAPPPIVFNHYACLNACLPSYLLLLLLELFQCWIKPNCFYLCQVRREGDGGIRRTVKQLLCHLIYRILCHEEAV